MKTITITEKPNKKTSELLAMCKEKFSAWSYYSDDTLDKEFPAAKESTVRHFLDEQEPDKETLGLSIKEAEEKGFTNGITLRERILLELAYFDQTGNHLDIKGVTFCSGSRYSGGYVPYARWSGGRFRIYWHYLGYSYDAYGVRSAVSLDSSSSNSSELDKAIEICKENGLTVSKSY